MPRYRANADAFAKINGALEAQLIKAGTEFDHVGSPAPDWTPLDQAAAQALAPVLGVLPLGSDMNGFGHEHVDIARALGWSGAGSSLNAIDHIRRFVAAPHPVA